MTAPWLIRARLKENAAVSALAPLLMPSGRDERLAAGHRLIWSLLSDGPDRSRDFLWRQTGAGSWIVLASRPPRQSPDLFEIEAKPFAPGLREGQSLGFSLRVNPVRSAAPAGAGMRGKRVDVVTRALRDTPAPARAAARETAVRDWLSRKGGAGGFTLDSARMRVVAEDWVSLRRQNGAAMTFCALDVEGVLTVRDPAGFLAQVRQGFGAAKAYGCGLMLVRPVPAADRITPEDEEDDLG